MKLSRMTPCQHFAIRVPRWKQRVVGLAKHKIGEHNCVEILAADKKGKRYYPGQYYIPGSRFSEVDYELDNQRGLTLVLVPISDLEPLERT